MATAVNIRTASYDVYVGRARRGQPPTKWGNPFIIGQKLNDNHLLMIGSYADTHHPSVGQVINHALAIELHRLRLHHMVETGALTSADFTPLNGMRIGCFCKPKSCHADTIVSFVKWFLANPNATCGPPANPK